MAHKKAAGSTQNGRDSQAKRLGVKVFGGQTVVAGNIIIRQRGNKYHAGKNAGVGKDHTIFALADGIVSFQEKKFVKFDGRVFKERLVNILPPAAAKAKKAAPVAKATAKSGAGRTKIAR